jgi:hypothetical protein
MMNWKGFSRKISWPNLRYYPGICLEGLKKRRKTSIRITGRRSRDLNPGPPEYDAGVLTTLPQRSVESMREGRGKKWGSNHFTLH